MPRYFHKIKNLLLTCLFLVSIFISFKSLKTSNSKIKLNLSKIKLIKSFKNLTKYHSNRSSNNLIINRLAHSYQIDHTLTSSNQDQLNFKINHKNQNQLIKNQINLIKLIEKILPLDQNLHSSSNWRKINQEKLLKFLKCSQKSLNFKKKFTKDFFNCQKENKEIILLSTVHFTRVLDGIFSNRAQFPAGEAIWADALLWALDQLDYPYLIVYGQDHHQTNSRVGEIYELLENGLNVKMIIGDYLSIPECLRNLHCRKSVQNPNRIPDYKLFVFDGFGQDLDHPLGRKWHLTFYPQQEKNFTYLGLTIEHYCHKFGVIPPEERQNKIFILGKETSYFYPPAPTPYSQTMWSSISNQTGIGFTVGTLQKNSNLNSQNHHQLDPKNRLLEGIQDIGTQTREQFIYQLQRHRAVIGLGWPVQPSTPLEALCVGTPFINPVWLGRRSISDRSKWHSQHPYLARFDPPYVYNVQDHREDDVLKAVQEILKNPLRSAFIPDDMKKENYLKRIDALIKFDWRRLSMQGND